MDKDKNNEHLIHYEVNEDPQTTAERELSPIEIMQKANIDPQHNYLIEIQGTKQHSYKDEPNTKIKVHNNQKFITAFTGPTQVA